MHARLGAQGFAPPLPLSSRPAALPAGRPAHPRAPNTPHPRTHHTLQPHAPLVDLFTPQVQALIFIRQFGGLCREAREGMESLQQ